MSDQTIKNWDINKMVQAVIDDDPDAEIIRESLTLSLQQFQQNKIGRLTHIDVSPIIEIRNKAGLTQRKFAEKLGISINTLKSWEQGQRKPSGAAAALLRLLNKRPELVAELN